MLNRKHLNDFVHDKWTIDFIDQGHRGSYEQVEWELVSALMTLELMFISLITSSSMSFPAYV